ncbi:MAG: hypothetical protein ACETVW_02845, partial [Dehalococcoidia bacterium]
IKGITQKVTDAKGKQVDAIKPYGEIAKVLQGEAVEKELTLLGYINEAPASIWQGLGLSEDVVARMPVVQEELSTALGTTYSSEQGETNPKDRVRVNRLKEIARWLLSKYRKCLYGGLWKRLLQQGLTEEEIRVIRENTKRPNTYKNFHSYKMGINRIKSLIATLEGPTVLIIEGPMGAGKSHLSQRLANGSDLGIDSHYISVFDEECIPQVDYDERELRAITDAFVRTLRKSEKEDRELVIYAGHFFMKGAHREVGVFKRTKKLLARYNIIRVKVDTIMNRQGEHYTVDGRFIPPVDFLDAERGSKLASMKRYISIGLGAVIQKSSMKLRLSDSADPNLPLPIRDFDKARETLEQVLDKNEIKLPEGVSSGELLSMLYFADEKGHVPIIALDQGTLVVWANPDAKKENPAQEDINAATLLRLTIVYYLAKGLREKGKNVGFLLDRPALEALNDKGAEGGRVSNLVAKRLLPSDFKEVVKDVPFVAQMEETRGKRGLIPEEGKVNVYVMYPAKRRDGFTVKEAMELGVRMIKSNVFFYCGRKLTLYEEEFNERQWKFIEELAKECRENNIGYVSELLFMVPVNKKAEEKEYQKTKEYMEAHAKATIEAAKRMKQIKGITLQKLAHPYPGEVAMSMFSEEERQAKLQELSEIVPGRWLILSAAEGWDTFHKKVLEAAKYGRITGMLVGRSPIKGITQKVTDAKGKQVDAIKPYGEIAKVLQGEAVEKELTLLGYINEAPASIWQGLGLSEDGVALIPAVRKELHTTIRGKGSPLRAAKVLIKLRDKAITEVSRKKFLEIYRKDFSNRTVDYEIKGLRRVGLIDPDWGIVRLAEEYKDITEEDLERMNEAAKEIIGKEGLDRWRLDDISQDQISILRKKLASIVSERRILFAVKSFLDGSDPNMSITNLRTLLARVYDSETLGRIIEGARGYAVHLQSESIWSHLGAGSDGITLEHIGQAGKDYKAIKDKLAEVISALTDRIRELRGHKAQSHASPQELVQTTGSPTARLASLRSIASVVVAVILGWASTGVAKDIGQQAGWGSTFEFPFGLGLWGILACAVAVVGFSAIYRQVGLSGTGIVEVEQVRLPQVLELEAVWQALKPLLGTRPGSVAAAVLRAQESAKGRWGWVVSQERPTQDEIRRLMELAEELRGVMPQLRTQEISYPTNREIINEMLVWSPEEMAGEVGEIEELARTVRETYERGEITEVVVIEEAGEYARVGPSITGKLIGYPKIHVLKATRPEAVWESERKINLEKTLFVTSSLGPAYQYFYRKLIRLLEGKGIPAKKIASQVGKHFVGIGEPNVPIAREAKSKFLKIFNVPEGRSAPYSVFSYQGLVPLALAGVNIRSFVDSGKMAEAMCREKDLGKNPGAQLTLLLEQMRQAGKQIVLVLPEQLKGFGEAWQGLISNLGGEGEQIISVTENKLAGPESYRENTAFIRVRAEVAKESLAIKQLREAGYSVHEIPIPGEEPMGGLFYLGEFVARLSYLMGIGPFRKPGGVATSIGLAEEMAGAKGLGRSEIKIAELLPDYEVNRELIERVKAPQVYLFDLETLLDMQLTKKLTDSGMDSEFKVKLNSLAVFALINDIVKAAQEAGNLDKIKFVFVSSNKLLKSEVMAKMLRDHMSACGLSPAVVASVIDEGLIIDGGMRGVVDIFGRISTRAVCSIINEWLFG